MKNDNAWEAQAKLSTEEQDSISKEFIRLCNTGWKITALCIENNEQHSHGQNALDKIIEALKTMHGSFDVVLNRLFSRAFWNGALFAELILDESGRNFIDIAMPNPAIAQFKKEADPIRGEVWKLGQVKNGQWNDLSQFLTIRYIPINPLPDSPYGQPLGQEALKPEIIKLVRRMAQDLLEHLFKTALRAQGIKTRVSFQFRNEAGVESDGQTPSRKSGRKPATKEEIKAKLRLLELTEQFRPNCKNYDLAVAQAIRELSEKDQLLLDTTNTVPAWNTVRGWRKLKKT